MAHPTRPSTGWKWIEPNDSMDSWFTMESTLRLKLSSLKVAWVLDKDAVISRAKPEPPSPGVMPTYVEQLFS